MEAKKVIVIVGQCPQRKEEIQRYIKDCIENITNDIEVNVFDLPRVGGVDTSEHFDNVYIHRYACPTQKMSDAIKRDWELVRDIVALGPNQCILKPSDVCQLQRFTDNIKKAMIQYGIRLEID